MNFQELILDFLHWQLGNGANGEVKLVENTNPTIKSVSGTDLRHKSHQSVSGFKPRNWKGNRMRIASARASQKQTLQRISSVAISFGSVERRQTAHPRSGKSSSGCKKLTSDTSVSSIAAWAQICTATYRSLPLADFTMATSDLEQTPAGKICAIALMVTTSAPNCNCNSFSSIALSFALAGLGFSKWKSNLNASGCPRSANWWHKTSLWIVLLKDAVFITKLEYRFKTRCFRSCTQHIGSILKWS